jgi:phosphate transport system ATP-binding protein
VLVTIVLLCSLCARLRDARACASSGDWPQTMDHLPPLDGPRAVRTRRPRGRDDRRSRSTSTASRSIYGDSGRSKTSRLQTRANLVTAFIGPSGCGQRAPSCGRSPDERRHPGNARRGTVLIDGSNIYDSSVTSWRSAGRVGMVFQKSNPFPKSIFENVA